jgi:hypothetical protein
MAKPETKARKKRVASGSVEAKKARRVKPDAVKDRPDGAPDEPVSLTSCFEKAVEKVRQKQETDGALAKLLRLLQVKKEFTGDRPSKVTVQWIDNWDEKSDET